MMENFETAGAGAVQIDGSSSRKKTITVAVAGIDEVQAGAKGNVCGSSFAIEMMNDDTKCDFGAELDVKARIIPQQVNVDVDVDEKKITTATATVAGKEEESGEGHLDAGDGENDDDSDSYQTDEESDECRRVVRRSLEKDMQAHGEQDTDESSSDSDYSDVSGLSDTSGREWKPASTRPINWVQKQIHSGANPRELLSQMLPPGATHIGPGVNDMMLWRILASMLSEPPRRQKLRDINTFDDVVGLVERSQHIIVLTGAGVSVSCGIPDFRSSDGIYSRLAKDYPDLPDPQAMFDINYFSRDPRPFYRFAREIYPGQFRPSPCHRFIRLLEQKGKLLRNYTQNIDTLEQVAGIRNVIECHGSFSTASCTKCKSKCTADAIRPDIFAQRIPVCPRCQPNVQQSVAASETVSEYELKQLVENGIMKPDIVFFGEGLPEVFHTVMASDKDKCDLLIVMGSSLKVRPVALIPSSIPANVPQILINREQLHHLEFDVELLGDSDVIINQLCHRLGGDWKEVCFSNEVLYESKELQPFAEDSTLESEEDGQQLQDTDTQSIKSSSSTDIALRSAGAYSDSGFESSTSSGAVLENKPGIQPKADDAVLCNQPQQPPADQNNAELLLDEPMDAVDYTNPSYLPFAALSHATAQNYRHLSIDSSKDSGIQCGDSSNSAATYNSTIGALLPPVASFSETDGTSTNCAGASASSSCALDTISATDMKVADTNAAEDEHTANISGSGSDGDIDSGRQLKMRLQKRQSAAERLQPGTYYCHESNAAYVFPGAQVSWYIDSEGGEEDDDEEDDEDDDDECDLDPNAPPLSPLLPPSVEAEMVSDITTSSDVATAGVYCAGAKRYATDDAQQENSTTQIDAQLMASSSSGSTRVNMMTSLVHCSPPATKRRRESYDNPPTSRETDSAVNMSTSTSSNTSTDSTSSSSPADCRSASSVSNSSCEVSNSSTLH